MGTSQSIPKINFEDMQTACKTKEVYFIINTLNNGEQDCLIIGTVNAQNEEVLINKHLTINKNIQIIIYGRNSHDDKTYEKYKQLVSLGFTQIYIYPGGLFEWLMLQDIYGYDEFPTTKKQLDFLKYKASQRLNVGLLEYSHR